MARWQRLSGNNVIFSTGTDEHGLKIQQAARNIKQENLAFCDNVSLKYKVLYIYIYIYIYVIHTILIYVYL